MAESKFIQEIKHIKVTLSFWPFSVEIGDFAYILELHYRKSTRLITVRLVVLYNQILFLYSCNKNTIKSRSMLKSDT